MAEHFEAKCDSANKKQIQMKLIKNFADNVLSKLGLITLILQVRKSISHWIEEKSQISEKQNRKAKSYLAIEVFESSSVWQTETEQPKYRAHHKAHSLFTYFQVQKLDPVRARHKPQLFFTSFKSKSLIPSVTKF